MPAEPELLQFSWYLLLQWTVAVQLAYYLAVFSRLAFYRQPKKPADAGRVPVSIIICARNEAANLAANLPVILEQEYAGYEVVVIDDVSTDGTKDILQSLAEKYPHLRYADADGPGGQGKKGPLTKGIGLAKHECLVLTDADCRPASRNWLHHISTPFSKKKSLITGYGAYERKSGWLNKLVRYETYLTALQYFSFHLAGMPYMGVGRNLAYTKTLFHRAGGFQKHIHLASGDDDLFVNQVASEENTALVLYPDAFTLSPGPGHVGEWIRQKRRHVRSGSRYRSFHKISLGGFLASQPLFYISGLISLAGNGSDDGVWIWIILRMIPMLIITYLCLNKLRERDLFLISPLLDVFFSFFYPLMFISGLVYKKHTWKTN